jgi:phosphoglycerol transferase MdoB-like AlkP superfamily enzyme
MIQKLTSLKNKTLIPLTKKIFLPGPLQPFWKFIILVISLNFILLFLLRLGFFLYFGMGNNFGLTSPDDQLKWSEVFYSFYLGGKFDLRLILCLNIFWPLLAILPFLYPRFKYRYQNKFPYKFWPIIFSLGLVTTIFFYIVDFGHYSYLKSRINSSLLHNIENPDIAFEMVWQTYPVIPLFILLILFIIGPSIWIKKLLIYVYQKENSAVTEDPNQAPKYFYLQHFLFLCLWCLGIYGKIGFYPLRWSEGHFSTNHFISSLSQNPLLFFIETLGHQKNENFDEARFKKVLPTLYDYLDISGKSETINFIRKEKPFIPEELYTDEYLLKLKNNINLKPNFVIIVLESNAAFKSKLFGNPFNATPYFDKLFQESLSFTKFYVPVQATARSIFALVTGIPDLSTVKTSSRNPLIVEQHSLINDLTNYEKFYFIGGSANWGNIRSLFSHNIKELKIVEEGMYESPRTDVWGISDYHLFEEANKKIVNNLNENPEKPFFALIQTAGFHRPYTIPEGINGFQLEKLSKEQKEKLVEDAGFESDKEYQSLRFQDFSLQHFFKVAKKEAYFDNTIFLIFGDHGLPVNNAKHVPEGERIHNFENFHVPFVIHAPKIIKRQIRHELMSELDVLPIILSFTGKPFINTTLGRNIFNERYKNKRKVFVYYWYMNPSTFGIIEDDFYYQISLNQNKGLYLYKSETPQKDVSNLFPDKAKYLEELALGIFYGSHYLKYNNQHLPQ